MSGNNRAILAASGMGLAGVFENVYLTPALSFHKLKGLKFVGLSSVGRARGCGPRGRGFESRSPTWKGKKLWNPQGGKGLIGAVYRRLVAAT